MCLLSCIRTVALFLLTVFVSASTLLAQTTGATLQGTVSDEQGAILPGASVTITNTETGWTRTMVSDERGWYRVIALPPGTYELQAELQGFAGYVRRGLTLTTGQEATVNASLKVAAMSETITVTGDAPLVETTRNTLGATVSRSELDSLPLIGRNFSGLTTLSPGITGVGGGNVTAAGQTERSNSYMVDGVSNDQVVTAGQRGGFSLEAVREFAVMANQFSAEFGQASGAVVSVITRSGTNDVQGRAFVFHRDDSLDAQDPFSTAQGSGKAPFSQQRYGAFLGGPLIRDKLHYFGTYEAERQRETSVISSDLVPIDERETPNPSDGHQVFFKTDHRLNDAQSLSLRYRADKDSSEGNSIGGDNSRERGTNGNSLVQDIVASHTYVISSRALNEFRIQFGRHSTWTDTEGWSVDGMPEINRPSIDLGKAYNQPQGRDENRAQIINNFTYTVGTHQLKAGLDISVIRAPTFFPRNRDGTFEFETDRAFDPADPGTFPSQFTQSIADPWVDLDEEIYAFFVQDSWRASNNVTLNVGIRYDRETAFSRINGVPDDTNNVAPRVGFVWDPFGTGRTAIRGGAGIYIDQMFLNPPLNVVLAQRANDITIIDPGFPDPFTQGVIDDSARSISVASTSLRTPETRSISLGFKRELFSGFAVSADGVYSRGYNQFNNRDLNPRDPATGMRPEPNYLRITQYETEGNSWYKALLMSVERRGGRGPAFGASYTLADSVRDVEGFLFLAQDQLNPAAEKARATNNRRHQLVAHLTWTLPGGVQVAGLFSARSGQPFNVTTGRDSNRDTETNDRPDLADPNGDPHDRSTYFVDFTDRVGNLSRNYATGDPFYTIDARVSKFQQLGGTRLEVFIEAFNLTNRVNFGTPVGNLRSSTFGRATEIQGSMRQVELGIRLDF